MTNNSQWRKFFSVRWGIKATVAFEHAISFEGHRAKLRGNGGHGLHGLPEIPALPVRVRFHPVQLTSHYAAHGRVSTLLSDKET